MRLSGLASFASKWEGSGQTEPSKERDRVGFGLTYRKEFMNARNFRSLCEEGLHLRPPREIEMAIEGTSPSHARQE